MRRRAETAAGDVSLLPGTGFTAVSGPENVPNCVALHRDCLQRLRRNLRIDRVVDNFGRGTLAESDRNIALHEQVHRSEFLLRIVGISEKLFQPLQLGVEIVETERDPDAIFIRDRRGNILSKSRSRGFENVFA